MGQTFYTLSREAWNDPELFDQLARLDPVSHLSMMVTTLLELCGYSPECCDSVSYVSWNGTLASQQA